MTSFTDLRLGIPKVSDKVFEKFGADVVLDLSGVEVYDLEGQC